jgi:hypothetical protein
MFLSILRVLFGFALACLAAGLTKVIFAFGLDNLLNGTDEQMTKALEYTALTATHHMLFSAPFALVVAAVGEWLSIRSWLYYVIAATAISVAGLTAIYAGEAGGPASVGNQYAITAYAVTGMIAGMVYWLFSGRKAGDDPVEPVNFSRPSGRPTVAQQKGAVPSAGSKSAAKPTTGPSGKRA